MSRGWTNETTTLFTSGTADDLVYHEGEYISIITGPVDTSTGTTGPVVLYRVKHVDTGFVDLTPISIQQLANEDLWFPTPAEIRRAQSIKACLELRDVHKRVPKTALRARTSFQQMARLPCYRGTRSR